MKINDKHVIDELVNTFDLLVDGYNEKNEIIRNQRLRGGLERFKTILNLLVNSCKEWGGWRMSLNSIVKQYENKLNKLTEEEIREMQRDFDSADDSAYDLPEEIEYVVGFESKI